MTPEELKEKIGWLKNAMGPKNAVRLRLYVDELVAAERERCAKIVEGWHYKKGGYGILAEEIRKG